MKNSLLARLQKDYDDLGATIRTLSRYTQAEASKTIGSTLDKAVAMFDESVGKTRKAGRKAAKRSGPKAGDIITDRIFAARKPLTRADLVDALKASAWEGNPVYVRQTVDATVRNGLKVGRYKETPKGIVKGVKK